MSGHSKWATIKHQKGVTDARRAQLFTKLAREVTVAARMGGGSPDMNVHLRLIIQKARDSNMPQENIERAIKKGTGEGGLQERLEEVIYEGYGPGGTAVMLRAFTPNRNRTASEVRFAFSRSGAALGESGCVAWLFEPKGVVLVETEMERAEEMAMLAIDAGAEDFKIEDSTLELYSSPEALEALRKAIERQEAKIISAELSMVPKSTILLDANTAEQTLRLLDRLEELEDVQRVYCNADFPDEVLERYRVEA
ncbi:MAG: YebC/PmpR family DNA-binding transcriptional regulator [Chloroflexi bacterium]|nr:YebC/PmpR family DNA-binding transcriptional regulator [Chloroflexota bacterium]